MPLNSSAHYRYLFNYFYSPYMKKNKLANIVSVKFPQNSIVYNLHNFSNSSMISGFWFLIIASLNKKFKCPRISGTQFTFRWELASVFWFKRLLNKKKIDKFMISF